MDTHKISRSMRWVTILPLDKDNWPSAPCPTLRELWVGVSSSKISESPCGVWGQQADSVVPVGLPWLRTRALGDLCFSLSLYPVCCPEDVWALCLWVLRLSSDSLRVSWQQLAPVVTAAFLSLDPVRLAARMVLNWGWPGALSEDEVGALGLWWPTAGPLDLSSMSCLQP